MLTNRLLELIQWILGEHKEPRNRGHQNEGDYWRIMTFHSFCFLTDRQTTRGDLHLSRRGHAESGTNEGGQGVRCQEGRRRGSHRLQTATLEAQCLCSPCSQRSAEPSMNRNTLLVSQYCLNKLLKECNRQYFKHLWNHEIHPAINDMSVLSWFYKKHFFFDTK